MKTIDEYIETFAPEIQKTLNEIRNFIRKEVPEATEKISYGMPAFFMNGNLVHFAAFKDHYSFFPSPSGIDDSFEKELAQYHTGKGTLQFPIDKPIPWKIIQKVVQFRVNQNLNKINRRKKMARPTNKKELLELSEANFNKLLEFIDGLPDEIKTKTYKNNELNDRDKTVSDVICHLHEWHLMMGNWYKVGMSGKKPAIPAEGFTFQTLPALNRKIWEKYKGTDLKKAITMFKKSHKDIMALIEKHSDNELFSKKKYDWTGTTSLGAYFISNTSSHYDWGLKTIKLLKKLVK